MRVRPAVAVRAGVERRDIGERLPRGGGRLARGTSRSWDRESSAPSLPPGSGVPAILSKADRAAGKLARPRMCAALAPWRSGYAAACKAVYTGSIPVGASTTYCWSAVPVGRPEQACRGVGGDDRIRAERRSAFVGLRSAGVWRVGIAPPSSVRSPIKPVRNCRELQASADVRVRRRVSAGRAATPARSSASGTVAPISADDQSKPSPPERTSGTTGALSACGSSRFLSALRRASSSVKRVESWAGSAVCCAAGLLPGPRRPWPTRSVRPRRR